MKARVWVEHEVEVDVTTKDVIAAIMSLPEPEQLLEALAVINNCYGLISRVPDAVVAQMNDKQRKVIGDALAAQAERYKVGSDFQRAQP